MELRSVAVGGGDRRLVLREGARVELERAELEAEGGGRSGEVALRGLPGAWRPTVKRGRGVAYSLWLTSIAETYDLAVDLETGRAHVRCRSAWVFEVGPENAIREIIERLSEWLYGKASVAWELQRLDLTSDWIGLPLTALPLDRFSRLSRAATAYGEGVESDDVLDGVREHYAGEVRTGVSLGRRDSAISAVIYDKTRELARNPRPYLAAEHRAGGWDGVESVTRIEFRLSQRGLRSWEGWPIDEATGEALSGTDPRILLRWGEVAPMLWAYLTTRWLRLVVPDEADGNRWRWSTDPRWVAVSSLGRSGTLQRADSVRALRLAEVRSRAEKKIVSGVLSLVASNPRLRLVPGRELEVMEREARKGLTRGLESWGRHRKVKGVRQLAVSLRIWAELPSFLHDAIAVRRKGYAPLFPTKVSEPDLEWNWARTSSAGEQRSLSKGEVWRLDPGSGRWGVGRQPAAVAYRYVGDQLVPIEGAS